MGRRAVEPIKHEEMIAIMTKLRTYNLTQKKLAAKINVDPVTISRWFKKNHISVGKKKEIFELLNIGEITPSIEEKMSLEDAVNRIIELGWEVEIRRKYV